MNKKIIHTVFEQVVQDRGDKVAVEDQVSSCTYHELNRLANQLAYLVLGMKLVKSSVIGAFLPPSVAFVAAQVGVWKSGHIYLPLNEQQPEEKLIKDLIKCNPSVLIVSREHLDRVKNLLDTSSLKVPHILVADQLSFSKVKSLESTISFPDTNPPVSIADDDPNYIYFTSGSTGDSKAIVGRHKSLSHFIHWEVATFQLNATVKTGFLNQTTFDASLRDIWVPLITGGTLFVPAVELRDDYGKLMKWTAEKQINLIHTVPSIFRLLTEVPSGLSLSHIEYVLLAGESLYAKDIHEWRSVTGNQATLVNLYGTSETTLAKTYYIVDDVPEESGTIIPVGKPISNTVIAILNNGTPCALGEVGEIFIKTPFVTGGYYQDEPLTKQVFVKNPLSDDPNDIIYKTGDLGRYQHDGNIEVLGRIDTQVKVNGIRVELEEVKRAILRLDAIREAEVLVHKNHFQNELVAYYTGKAYDVDEIREQLSFLLNRGMIPTYFMHLDQLPLMINGKVDKKALPRPDKVLFNDASFEAPQGRTEEIIGEVWMKILNISEIDRNISFFKVGGTSLKAIQIISRLNREFNISLKAIDIFNHSTLKRLAQVVYKKNQEKGIAHRPGHEPDEIVPVAPQPHYDVSQAQKGVWLVEQSRDTGGLYNMSSTYQLTGRLSQAALQQALDALALRHETLRTTFEEVNGELRQKIQPAGVDKRSLEWLDVRSLSSPDEVILDRISSEKRQSFNLRQGPLYKIILFQKAEGQYVLFFNIHHIICDGWSLEVFSDEFLQFYQGAVHQKSVLIPPLSIQYKDFTHWHNELLANSADCSSLLYWSDVLEDAAFKVGFPTDYSPGSRPTAGGGQYIFWLDRDQSTQLTSLLKQEECSLYMGGLTLVNLLLYARTGNTDLLVGSPFAGRLHRELESQIGLFVNVLLLRTRICEDQSFQRLLLETKSQVLKASEHQHWPFVGDFSSLEILVQSQDMVGEKELAVEGLDIEVFPTEHHTSKVALTFNFKEEGDRVLIGIEYDKGLFRLSSIKRIGNELSYLIDQVLADSQSKAAHLKKKLVDLDCCRCAASCVPTHSCTLKSSQPGILDKRLST